MKRMLTVRETARELGVHENTVRRWAERGVLRSARLPGSGFRRFDSAEVLALARHMRSGQYASAAALQESVMAEGGLQVSSSGHAGGLDVRQASLAYWMEQAEAHGFHVPPEVYNTRLAVQPAAAWQLEETAAELPGPWSEHFRPLTLKEVLGLIENGE